MQGYRYIKRQREIQKQVQKGIDLYREKGIKENLETVDREIKINSLIYKKEQKDIQRYTERERAKQSDNYIYRQRQRDRYRVTEIERQRQKYRDRETEQIVRNIEIGST